MRACDMYTKFWSIKCHTPYIYIYIYIFKIQKRSYLVHKAPTFVRSRKSHSRQPHPEFYLKRLIPKLEPATCRFW